MSQIRDVKAVKHSDTEVQLIMVTDKAKKVWLDNIDPALGTPEYTGIVKLDQMADILVWVLSWDLTLESEVTITIKGRATS